MKHHAIQDYTFSLSGNKPIAPASFLEVELIFDGEQESPFSNLAPDVPEITTKRRPFSVEITKVPVILKFSYSENAFCIWNNMSLFTSLPGEELPLGEMAGC